MINVPINEDDLKILAEQIETGICPIEDLPREVMQIIFFAFMEYSEEAINRAKAAKKSLDEARKTAAEIEKITEKREKDASMAQGAFFAVARLAEEKKEEACT